MSKFSGGDANQAIIAFLIETDPSILPVEVRDHLTSSIGGPDGLTAIVNTAETLYAYREEIPEGHQLALDLAEFVSEHRFRGMGGPTGRMTQIAAIMDRVITDGIVTEERDLERHPTFAPPVEEELVLEEPLPEEDPS